MLSLTMFVLLAVVAATPSLVISLANHANLGEPEGGKALRAAAIFAIAAGGMALAGYWIGRWLGVMIGDDTEWVVDTVWFVVGLKMIFTSFKLHPRDRSINLSSPGITLLAGVASAIDSLLISMALGLIREEINLFVVYVTGIVMLFSLSGLKLLSSSEFMVRHSPRLLLLSGCLMMILVLFAL